LLEQSFTARMPLLTTASSAALFEQ